MTDKLCFQWFPPSWVRIRYDRYILDIDPAFLPSLYPGSWQKGLTQESLPTDGMEFPQSILLTHHHNDHCKRETLEELISKETEVYGPQNCRKKWSELEIVSSGWEKQLGPFWLRAVPAYNTEQGHSTRKVHKKGAGLGYLLEVGGVWIYHAGDTDIIPEMEDFPSVDHGFLPIGGTFTMDMEEAVRAAEIIGAKTVYPIHLKSQGKPELFRERLESFCSCQVVIPSIARPIWV